MKRVRLVQLDGKLPNLALAKLYAWHRSRGDDVHFRQHPQWDLFDAPRYDVVYGSAIFTRSRPLIDRLKREFPGAIVGGTGSGTWDTIEDLIGSDFQAVDFTPWPDYRFSLGFTQRGCRLRCKPCVVPRKEGAPRATSTIADIWRGPGFPKSIVLLDNDVFGQPRDAWQARFAEIREGNFRVSFNQGINVRIITDEAAEAIASVRYCDDDFTTRRLYTAFDNARDETVFRVGVERLFKYGVKGRHIMAYVLIGFDASETDSAIFRRINVLKSYGILPYPMVYQAFDEDGIFIPKNFDFGSIAELYPEAVATIKQAAPKTVAELRKVANLEPNDAHVAAEAVLEAWSERYRHLKDIQRWVNRRHYHILPFEDYLACPEGRRRDLHLRSRSLFDEDDALEPA